MNVLANLIAAMIVYLLGVAVGIFPRSKDALVIASLCLACGLFYVLTIAEKVVRSEQQRRVFAAASLVPLSMVGPIYATAATEPGEGAWWFFMVMGLALLGSFSSLFVQYYRRMKAAKADNRSIKVLHWYEPGAERHAGP